MNAHTELGDRRPRMLVTGAAGMTGHHVPQAFVGYDLKLTDIDTLDVREVTQVREACEQFCPDVVLHLAAETDIDLCELQPKHAFLTNAVGTQNVALVCQDMKSLLAYFSTTSVFAGEPDTAYSEFDTPKPIHIHGRSKLAGEQLVASFTTRSLIVRPGWMFGGFDKDKKLVGTLRRQIVYEGKTTIRGVTNTKGSPTYALDCLKMTRLLIDRNLVGTFHVVNSGHCSRYQLAEVVAEHYGVSVERSRAGAFRTETRRPSSEMVENWMLEFHGLVEYARDWRSALKEYLEQWDTLDPPSRDAR